MYAGFGAIIVSNGLQLVGSFSSSLVGFTIAGLAVSTGSIIFTIFQAQKSASESQQQIDTGDQRIWEMTEPGRAHIARTKVLHDMREAEHERNKL
jgi:hypothetical protein